MVKVKEVERAFDKLEMKVKNTHHKVASFYHKGKKVLMTRLSHGSGDASSPDKIRQQLKLNEDQFRDLLKCPLDRKRYIAILKEKRLIE